MASPKPRHRPARVTLYDYQDDAVSRIVAYLKGGRDALGELPTGAGKTLMARLIAWMMLGEGFSGVVIAAPAICIEDGFVSPDELVLSRPDGGEVTIPAAGVRKAREAGGTSTRAILDYLRCDAPGYALSCSHQAARRIGMAVPPEIPADLSRKLLVIDECHHAPADGLATFVEAWSTRGGRLLYLSAMAARGDGRPVARPGMGVVRRTVDEQMESGHAPGNLAHEVEPIGKVGDVVTGSMLTGGAASDDPAFVAEVAGKMVARWIADGRPRTVVRLPPLKGGSGAVVAAVVSRFGAAGARVLDTTGAGKDRQGGILDALAGERDREVAQSLYDVVVGCQRVREGFDWRHCSTVYMLGIPGSIPEAIQVIGRAMRKKPRSYPLPEREICRAVFFVPTAGGKALGQLDAEHSRAALLTIVFMADREAGEAWVVTREVRQGSGNPRAELPGVLEPAAHATVKAIMAGAAEGKSRVTVGELVDAVLLRIPGIDRPALDSIAVAFLAASASDVGRRARRAIRERSSPEFRCRPEIAEGMAEAFAAILDEFRGERIGVPRSLKALAGMAHSLTGESIRNWGKRSCWTLFTEELAASVIGEYRDLHGKFPSVVSGELPGLAGRTFRNLEGWLCYPPRNSSLAQFIDDRFGREKVPVTESFAIHHAGIFAERHGYLPGYNSGPVADCPARTWGQVAGWFFRNGLSMSDVLAARFPQYGYRWEWSEELLAAEARSHHERHGALPGNKSGDIPGSGGRNWAAAAVWLKTHKKMKMSEFMAKHFPGLYVIWEWSDAVILREARAYLAATGLPPTKKTGVIPGSGGRSWSDADCHLRRSRTPRTTLSKFLRARFPGHYGKKGYKTRSSNIAQAS